MKPGGRRAARHQGVGCFAIPIVGLVIGLVLPPVEVVEIPKPHGGGTRILGVPTISGWPGHVCRPKIQTFESLHAPVS